MGIDIDLSATPSRHAPRRTRLARLDRPGSGRAASRAALGAAAAAVSLSGVAAAVAAAAPAVAAAAAPRTAPAGPSVPAGTGALAGAAARAADATTPRLGGGSLVATGKVAIGRAPGADLYQLVDTEAPNGAFYYSFGSTVEVVRGDGAPSKVLTPQGDVLALAATASDIYVETGLTVSEYSLPAVTLRRRWSLPENRFAAAHALPTSAGLVAGGGAVWAWTDWATDQSGFQPAYLQELTGATAPRLVDESAYPGWVAAGASGLYYENMAGHLVEAAAGGRRTVSHETVPTDSPIVVASGSVLLFGIEQPSGAPVLDRYDATSLGLEATAHPEALVTRVAETSLGLLGQVCQGSSCASSDVAVLDPLDATTSAALSVSGLYQLVEGSAPAVVADVAGEAYLERLALPPHGGAPSAHGGAPSSVPVLGARSFYAPGGVGWGTAAPREIFNGGDPSGEVQAITWTGWGKPAADGHGKGFIFRPTGGYYPAVEVELQAFALGHCSPGGPLAYTRLDIRVPSRPGAALGAWQPWGGGTGSICKVPGT
ncbi:MAG TPA: hypothetical protein VMD59_23835 [Acidimicrobiales bacterium]|nr:hypothetical protein [Acidimicrobiales bacterium]